MADVGIGPILNTVIGGLILAGILYLIRTYWRDNPVRRWLQNRRIEKECKRLLWTFRLMGGDYLDRPLLVEDAAKQASVKEPSAAVHRLLDRGLIVPHSGQPTPAYIRMTLAGVRSAPPPSTERRSRWSRIFGG
jgi:hypothetical protein